MIDNSHSEADATSKVRAESLEWGSRRAGEGGRCCLLTVQSSKCCVQHLDDYFLMIACSKEISETTRLMFTKFSGMVDMLV